MTKKTPIILNRLADALDAQGVKLKRQQLLRVAASAFGYRDDNAFSAADRDGALDVPKGVLTGVDDLGLVVIEDPLAGMPFAMDVLSREARAGRWTVTPYGNLIDIGHIAEAPKNVARRRIHSAMVTHKHGTDVYLGLTETILEAELAGYCRQWWSEVVAMDSSLPEEPDGMSDAEIVSTYFDTMTDHEGGEHLDRQSPQEIALMEPSARRRGGGHVYGRMDHDVDDVPVWWDGAEWGDLSRARRYDVADGDPSGTGQGFWEALPGCDTTAGAMTASSAADGQSSEWNVVYDETIHQAAGLLGKEPIVPAEGVVIDQVEMQTKCIDETTSTRVVMRGMVTSADGATAWRERLRSEINMRGLDIEIGFDRLRVMLPNDGDVTKADMPEDWLRAVRDLLTPAAGRERIMADFRAEAWVRNNAIEVDVDEAKEIDVTYEMLLMGHERAAELRSRNSDHLLKAVRSPQWIREWSGPFTIAAETAVENARDQFGE